MVIPTIKEQWLPQYSHMQTCFKLLVLDGEARSGKRVFAEHFAGRERTLTLNMSATKHPDLSSFQRQQHDVIVFLRVPRADGPGLHEGAAGPMTTCAMLGQSATQ